MEKDIKTNIWKEFSKNESYKTEILSEGKEYVYHIFSARISYIIKGYELKLDKNNKDEFANCLKTMMDISQEYNYLKMLSILSPHIAKPLKMDYEVEFDISNPTMTQIYIEILFEYPGVPLSNITKLDISTAYNVMRQSTNIISFIDNFDQNFSIHPSNLFYDNEANLLKILGCSSPSNSSIDCSKDNDIRNLTNWANYISKIIIGKCQIIADKNQIKNMQENNEIETIKANIEDIHAEGEDIGKKSIILNELTTVLNNSSNTTLMMSKIVISMRIHEKNNNIKESYSKIENSNRRKLLRFFMLNEDFKKNSIHKKILNNSIDNTKELTENSIKRIEEEFKKRCDETIMRKLITGKSWLNSKIPMYCKDCVEGKNIKLKLECNHSLCTYCTKKYIIDVLVGNIQYDYSIQCPFCEISFKISNKAHNL